MRSTLRVLALGILASGLAVRPVAAATASASLSVTATVQVSCLVSATATAFRPHAADAASAVSVACSNSTPYSVRLSAALVPGAASAIQKMTRSGVVLPGYVLSSNSRGVVKCGQALGADAVAGSGSGAAPVLAIHGRISAAKSASAAAFADTMTVLVTY